MRTTVAIVSAVALLSGPLVAQERKPVPKDSVRVFVPGCTNEIKAHEGSMIEITGLMKKGQEQPNGVGIGGGVRVSPGPSGGGGLSPGTGVSQSFIDVESWRQIEGSCPSR